MKLEIKRLGNSDGLLLPRELMQRLDLKRGQQLHIETDAAFGRQRLKHVHSELVPGLGREGR